jgi:hypothetical protein
MVVVGQLYIYCFQYVKFYVLSVTNVKMTAFWDMMPCSLIEIGVCKCIPPLKHWSASSRLHGTISQKALIVSELDVWMFLFTAFSISVYWTQQSLQRAPLFLTYNPLIPVLKVLSFIAICKVLGPRHSFTYITITLALSYFVM